MEIIIEKNNRQQEFMILYKKMKNGDFKAREEIILRTYPIVLFWIKKKYRGNYHQIEEYKSQGLIGLIKAVDSYSPDKNTNFATYATRCIHNEIGMYIRKEKNKINSSTCSCYNKNNEVISIVSLIYSNENIEEDFLDKMQIEDLLKVVENLPQRDRDIIINYFGLNGLERLTMQKVAEKIGITQSYVSKLLPSIIKSIKEKMQNLGYEGETHKIVRTAR